MSILRRWRDKRVIKIVTGIRRCGKSSLLRMFQEHLIQSGVSDSQVQAINFEDIDNAVQPRQKPPSRRSDELPLLR